MPPAPHFPLILSNHSCLPPFSSFSSDCSHTRAIKAEEDAEEEARRRNEGLISDLSSDEEEEDAVEGAQPIVGEGVAGDGMES